MSTRGKAADRNFLRQQVPCFRTGTEQANGRVELAQGLVMPRALPYTISKDGRMVSRRSELQGHRVRLPGADMVIAPAGHHDHHRAAQRIGHGLGSVPQIDGQTPAARERALFQTHGGSSLSFLCSLQSGCGLHLLIIAL